MNEDRKELKLIQEKLEHLSAKQLELVQHHQQQPFYYRWLATPGPELDAINTQIADLKRREGEYFKVIQNAASVPPPPTLAPEKDWSKSPFYSEKLKSWNFDYPVDQMGLYLTGITGFGLVSKAMWKSWNIKKAAEALEKGVDSDMLAFHRHFSGLNNEQLKDANKMRQVVKFKAFAAAGIFIAAFSAFVQIKNRNRLIK